VPTIGAAAEVTLGLAACAFAAAAAFTCHIRRRRRRRRSANGTYSDKSLRNEPLLRLDGGDSGLGAADSEDAGVAAQRLQLAQEVQYDPRTGFPANMAAKQLAALNWRAGPGSAAGAAGVVVALPFAELVQATHNFDAFNELGTGGSCGVFKGHVFGLQVAVKKLNAGSSDWAEQQFTSEMELLTKIAHQNVVSLYAFSTDGPNRCLVLELCTGGALNDRLSCKAQAGSPPPPPLRWQQRVQIAQDILQALEFLHGLTPQMIHR
jgi:serine/threonine protein kinase